MQVIEPCILSDIIFALAEANPELQLAFLLLSPSQCTYYGLHNAPLFKSSGLVGGVI